MHPTCGGVDREDPVMGPVDDQDADVVSGDLGDAGPKWVIHVITAATDAYGDPNTAYFKSFR
jgi:hypothetical protein